MTEVYQSPRERRTAYFIVAVMVFALLWFAGKAGWLGGWLDDDVTEAPQVSPAEDITYQRGLVLPLMPLKELTVLFDGPALSNLRSNGINWIMVRVPVWTPSPRRFEYDGLDLARLSGIVETAHAVGMGFTLAPVYWDGSTLSTLPPVPVSATLFGQYRDMLHDFAVIAAESGADALLLDGLFGSTDVSAAEWVEVIEDLRLRFPGRIEIRTDKGHTGLLYLNQLDAAHLTATGDTTAHPVPDILAATLGAFPDKGLRFHMPDPDVYAAGDMPWQPVLKRTGDLATSLEYLSSPLLSLEYCRGFFIGGRATFDVLGSAPTSDAPLARALRAHSEAHLRSVLEKRRNKRSLRSL
jgi:hypothetical protein